ncbi:ATP-binding protein [Enterococcus faecium]|uniref:ATP-binding protein n=1 Tax=Enterococcus faecium TaxID=1352 RepID=UPI00039A9825|nr:ATP-binding protein [Enterococcus faecium]EGP5584147.1 TFIIB-type zinc ribbon-containing protein [Enterococcus faecium]EMF0608233.1 TFIIB-type zinc ribbon-containing protein [Enterococcus faecium]MBW4156994.1 TFIIB-type zinc ribbon-containing protein [Enterococcus faecium]MCD4988135.1 TFIIB-type zinc ribbon-containing protein [Enterococcus faecium]MCU2051500.1 TFIIB-type zinc ribbon-containing protein [Enterococcus faecium]
MDVLTHKCPNCGGPLTFDPKDQKFHCEYCLNIYTEEEVSQYEQKQKEARMAGEESKEEPSPTEDFTFTAQEQLADMNEAERKAVDEAGGFSDTADESADNTAAMDLFLCPNCGAEIVTDATTAATYCYYCHNPVVLSGRLSGEFLPNKVLPFAVEKEEAINRFLTWTKKKWFVPKAFFNKDQIDKLTGVYFPYWATDAEVDGAMQANGTVIRIWRIGDIEYTETKQFAVSRAGKLSFKELVKNALSKNTQQKMVEGVQPFPLDKAIDFKSQYLAGFQAEKRDIEYEAIKSQIQSELKDYSEKLLKDTANGYTTLTGVRTSASITNEVNNYVLLPVWLVTYRSNDSSKKVYYYAMNGQTGKVSGVLPISQKKLGLTALGIFAGLAILFLIGGYLI